MQAKARIGTTLRKWRVDRLIDVGGMAAVYAATHRNTNRVALKILHPQLSQHEDVRERFLREGYVANSVEHPGAVSVLDDDVTPDGAPFLVMELLEGESLQSRLERPPPLALADTIFVAEQLLDVLAAAHDKNIVHRDIKPANVYLTNKGTVKLLDFGLARVRDSEAYLQTTRDGIVMGTAAFMAPEQAHAQTELVDPRADQWAVGALVFYLLTGKYVHEGKTMLDRILAAARTPARSLATVAPQLPASLVAIVDRSLAFRKEARFPDTRAMRDAMHEVATSLGIARESVRDSRTSSSSSSKRIPLPRPESVTLDPAELVDERSIATRLMEKTPVALAPKLRREDVGELPNVEVASGDDAPDSDDQMPTLVKDTSSSKKRRR
jgi:serine/threonine-protein kinase